MTELYEKLCAKAGALSMVPSTQGMIADLQQQRLFLFEAGQLRCDFVISSSAAPPSNRHHSGGTPEGLHTVCEIIGRGEPVGTVFRGRRPIASHFRELPEEEQAKNLITSRILRLRGLEPGINAGPGVDSFDRYIYLHGTHRPEKLGTPFSGGCLLLSDEDIVWLADRLALGSLLLILPPGNNQSRRM